MATVTRKLVPASAALAIACALLPGCITEKTRRPADAQPAFGAAARSDADRIRTGDRRGNAMELPSAPIAQPAKDARSVESQVLVAVEPIGELPYDGQILPIISPDGAFAAVSTGEPPTWPTILAQHGGAAPNAQIRLFDIASAPPREITPVTALPDGLVLGRDADARGVLVESPRADGSRWIGRIHWLTGELTWLVQDQFVNAHAVFGPDGLLIWSRREVGRLESSIIMRGSASDHAIAPDTDSALALPTMGTTDDVLYIFSAAPKSLELRAVRLTSGGRPGMVIARRTLAGEGSLLLASQAVAVVQNAFGAASPSWNESPAFVFLHPAEARMVVLDVNSGALTKLAPKSIAACPADTPLPSVYITTPEGLSHQIIRPGTTGGFPEALPAAKVLADAFVPRSTTNPDRPVVLIGPAGAARDRLRLVGLRAVTRPAPQTPAP